MRTASFDRPLIAGLAIAFAACTDSAVPTAPPNEAVVTGSALAARNDHAGAIVAHDSCDPDSFNAVLGDGTCVKPGRTTFDELIAELTATQTVRSWRFNPLEATARMGVDMLAINVGGEAHTFTPVAAFGGGFIPELNTLSGNLVPAPECLNVPGLDFVAGGEKSLIPGDALAAVAAGGVAHVQCCLHPWMRSDVRLK